MDTPSPLFRPAGAGTRRNVLGMSHVDKVSPDETGGAFLLIEVTVPPGHGAPMHRHHIDAECFYILDGELSFAGPSGRFTARTGDTCFLQATAMHAFRNEGAVPARALVITAPGRDAERFFGEIDAAMGEGMPEFEVVSEIAARHRLTILPSATAL